MNGGVTNPAIQEILLGASVVIGVIFLLALSLLFARARLIPVEALEVTVNESLTIAANRGDKLLDILQSAGIGIPAACGGSGTCGLCRVHVDGEGAGQAQATEKGVLSGAERRAHLRLACQTSVRGPCAVTVPSSFLGATGFDCRVVSNEMLAPLIRELVLELPDDHKFSFRAGDFMQLTAPSYQLDFAAIKIADSFHDAWRIADWDSLKSSVDSQTTRAYSVACRTEDVRAKRLVFNIRLAVPPAGREKEIPPGKVSSWLFALEPDDDILVSGPFGDFHVQPTQREKIFIGGGVGMAPMRAMIHEQITDGTTVPMQFFYGARSAGDLFYVEEFDRLADENKNFQWIPALSDPAPGDRWTGETGFIHDTVRSFLMKHPAADECEYYLCGPPLMISAVLNVLARLGVEPHMIHNDDFGA